MADEQSKLSVVGEEHDLNDEQERQGGARLNRRALIVGASVLILASVFVVQGIRSAGVTNRKTEARPVSDEAGQAARDKAEMEELKARAMRAEPSPAVTVPIAPPVEPQLNVQHSPKPPSRYGNGPKTSTCARSKHRRWSRPSTAAARLKSPEHRASTTTHR